MMLDRIQLMQELRQYSSSLFIDLEPTLSRVRELWQEMVSDPLFQARAQAATAWPTLPTWHEKLDDAHSVSPYKKPYNIVATDGSQIYPDKHQGTTCALINIGSVILNYGTTSSQAKCISTPYVMHEMNRDATNDFSADWINSKRQEYEFRAGIEHTHNLHPNSQSTPTLYFFDGSLIFWHLEAKEPTLRQFFIDSYTSQLEALYNTQTLMAGYISLPKGKDLVNLVRFYLEEKNHPAANDLKEQLNNLVDTHLTSFFLQPHERTTIFKSNSSITRYYPQHLKPYFFYLHVGNEVARVELPAWIAQQNSTLDLICAQILDQCNKGDGYPVGLAESHEQAVVKGPDREFFYMLLTKLGHEQQRSITISRKSLKKRGLGI